MGIYKRGGGVCWHFHRHVKIVTRRAAEETPPPTVGREEVFSIHPKCILWATLCAPSPCKKIKIRIQIKGQGRTRRTRVEVESAFTFTSPLLQPLPSRGEEQRRHFISPPPRGTESGPPPPCSFSPLRWTGPAPRLAQRSQALPIICTDP